jgi:preprotein translocase SecE subunit
MDSVQVRQPANRLTGWFHRSSSFLVSVRDELKKVTWPTRPELIKATRMVVILSLILGITIGILDWVLQLILVRGVAAIAQ